MAENWKGLATSLNYTTETEMWQDLYLEQKLTIQQLSLRLGYGTHTIRRRMLLCSIDMRQRGGPRTSAYNRGKVFHLDQRCVWTMSVQELCKALNVSQDVIYRYKKYLGGKCNGILYHISDRGVREICNFVEDPPRSISSRGTAV